MARKKGFKHTEETKKKIGLANKGKRSKLDWRKVKISKEKLKDLYFKEGLTSKEIGEILKISSTTVGNYLEDYNLLRRDRWEVGKINRKKLIGTHRPKKVREKIRKTLTGKKFSPERIRNILKACFKKPNKGEQQLLNLIKENKFPFKYTGDGGFIVEGRCPDFLRINGKKQVIELFGEIWHNPNNAWFKIPEYKTKEGTINHYKKYEFDCLIIWWEELKNPKQIINKIKNFI